ncbi:hypothetical protein [Thalassotalea crassostreae]|uniref:hypothetical protein n=1 Tax=Thalassotalea crassostreae TaxID=1763536 RepID=UPI0008391FF9|nr:hypothetical protein [Thalassotalea crassostreae]
MKYLIIMLFSLTLSSCGGGGSGKSEDQRQLPYPNQSPTLNDLVGVWDSTTVDDGLEDISYNVIESDGTIVFYDYDGDAYDQGDDCYYIGLIDINFKNLGSGQFEISLEDFDVGGGFIYNLSQKMQLTLLDQNTLEIQGIEQLTQIDFEGQIVLFEMVTVLDTNHVNIQIIEHSEEYNIALSREDGSDDWSVDSGSYFDLDYLYDIASIADINTNTRMNLTKDDLTPDCSDFGPPNSPPKNFYNPIILKNYKVRF